MKKLIFIAALALAAQASASTPGETKTYDASQVRGAFLMRGVGARPVGMGEAFSAVADDASALQWNPAGLASVRRYNLVAMYDMVGLGMDQNYGALALPMGGGTAALGLNILNYGSFDVRDSSGVKTGTQSASDVSASLGWGFRADNALGIHGFSAMNGAALSVVNEAVGGSMIGLSLGSLLPMGKYFSMGATVQNISLSRDTYQLPSAARLAFAGSVPGTFKAALDISYPIIDKNFSTAFGLEYTPIRAIAIRAGYKWLGVEQGLSGMTGLSAGLGLGLGGLMLDYAYQPYGDLMTSHRVSLSYLFGSDSPTPSNAAPRAAAPAPAPQPVAAQPVQQPVAMAPSNTPPALPGTSMASADPMAMGKQLEAEGKTVEAMKAYNEAIKVDGKNHQAWRALGMLYFKAGKKAYAIQCFEQVQKLNPGDAGFAGWLQQYRAR